MHQDKTSLLRVLPMLLHRGEHLTTWWHASTCVDHNVSWSGPKKNTSWMPWCHQAARSTQSTSWINPSTTLQFAPSPHCLSCQLWTGLNRLQTAMVHYGQDTALQSSAILCAWNTGEHLLETFNEFGSETSPCLTPRRSKIFTVIFGWFFQVPGWLQLWFSTNITAITDICWNLIQPRGVFTVLSWPANQGEDCSQVKHKRRYTITRPGCWCQTRKGLAETAAQGPPLSFPEVTSFK